MRITDSLRVTDTTGSDMSSTCAQLHGFVGMLMSSGQVVLTGMGHETTPFPKVDCSSPRKTGNTLRRVDGWLMHNALIEARARGDRFNARQFEHAMRRPTQSDKDGAEAYLFAGGSKVCAS